MTPRVLSRELRELQQRGLITRKQYDGLPLRVKYSLTELGCGLRPVLDAIVEWPDRGARGNSRDYAYFAGAAAVMAKMALA